MLSQGVSDDFETWFGPIAIQHNVRLVFLRRWVSAARLPLGGVGAADDGAPIYLQLFCTAHRLKSGPAIGQLVYYKKKWRASRVCMRHKCSYLLGPVYYESLVDDPRSSRLISGMLFDDAAKRPLLPPSAA